MVLLPLVLIPMVIFGGTLLPIHDMQRFVRPAAFIMPTRHGFEAMLLLEAERKPLGPSPYSNTIVADCSIDDPDRPDLRRILFTEEEAAGSHGQRRSAERRLRGDVGGRVADPPLPRRALALCADRFAGVTHRPFTVPYPSSTSTASRRAMRSSIGGCVLK